MTHSVPHIRPAVVADAANLQPLLAAVGFPAAASTIAARLQNLAAPSDFALVAELNGRLVGLLTAHLTPALHRAHPVGRITLLAVDELFRGQGVGKALMESAENRLRAAGCAIVEVISNRRFQDAHEFYQRIGYDFTSLKFKKTLGV